MAVVEEVSLKTQAKDGIMPSLIKASGEHIEILGQFARVFEVTTYVITAKSPEPQTEMLVADKKMGKVGIRILIKLQSASLPPSLK